MKKETKKLPLFVYPTYLCNLSCSYCFTNSDNRQSDDTYMLNNWEHFIKECINAEVTEIRISGGEPFKIKILEAMISSIYLNKLSYTITTNGLLLKQNLHLLEKFSPSQLWISFHKEYHSKEKWLNIIQNASKVVQNIGVNIFISYLEEIELDLKNLAIAGVSKIKVLEETLIGRNKKTSKKITKGQFLELQQACIKYQIECRVEGYEISLNDMGKHTCVLNEKLVLSISPDGLIYPCCITVENQESIVGDLKKQTLHKIIEQYAFDKKNKLPCYRILPNIEKGSQKCPLVLDSVLPINK